MEKVNIYFVVYPGFELLDLAGPSSVFSNANTLSQKTLYEIRLISVEGGTITTDCGMMMQTMAMRDVKTLQTDTVLVVGAQEEALKRALREKALLVYLQEWSEAVSKIGSICSGTFLLAQAGVLQNKKSTTHWSACDALAKYYPDTSVNPNSLYIVDGNRWTSAGVTTGIDMCLAMLELDHGKELMGKVAKYLVVYARRPGNQSQFSQVLDDQLKVSDRFADVLHWISNNLEQTITVPKLAEKVCLSERSFFRKFEAELGTTPAKYVEKLRVNKAKMLLGEGLSVKRVTASVGFRSEAAFRKVFTKETGISPSKYATLHSY